MFAYTMEDTMETMESFEARVLAATGHPLFVLPVRVVRDGDTIGHILAKRGNMFVCGVGIPDEDIDGSECFRSFEVALATV